MAAGAAMLSFPCRRKEKRAGSIRRVSSLPSHKVAAPTIATHFEATMSFRLPENGPVSHERSDRINYRYPDRQTDTQGCWVHLHCLHFAFLLKRHWIVYVLNDLIPREQIDWMLISTAHRAQSSLDAHGQVHFPEHH